MKGTPPCPGTSSLTPPVLGFPATLALGRGRHTEPLSGKPWYGGRMGSSSLASRTHWVILDVFLDLRGHLSAHTLGAGGTPLLRRHAGCVRTPDITHAAEGTPLSALPPSGLFKLIYLLTYFWLCWVLVAALGLCSSCGERGPPWLLGTGFSLQWLLWSQSRGSRARGLRALRHGPSCPEARGIFPDHGLVLCPLHWQVDS